MDGIERTLILLKPDALQRDLLGAIISRFERKGLKIVGMKLINLSDELLDEHYSHHVGKGFFDDLKTFMKQTPVVGIVLEGFGAIDEVRKVLGSTNPQEADAGTIRADFAMKISSNLTHASDSPENAEAEIGRFFNEDEIFSYEKITDKFLYGEGI